jgi:hypothetical protein
MNELLLEYMGTLLVCATVMYTHGNALMVGSAHAIAIQIAKGYFNPLFLFLEYSVGRIPLWDALTILLVEISAMATIALTYIHVPLE